MRLSLSVLCLLALSVTNLLSQIGAEVQSRNPVFGNWENNQYGYQMILTLRPDGSGSFDGEPLTFAVDKNLLSITQFGAVNKYTFFLEGNSLRLSGGDLDQAITFTKSNNVFAESQESTLNAQNEESVNPQVPGDPSSSASNTIVGVWSASGESIEFKSNGHCVYLGKTYPYKVTREQLILSTPEGDLTFTCSVSENQLVLSVGQNAVTYTRNVTGSTTIPSGQFGNTGMVDQSLVGKWCYVDVNSYNQGSSSSNTCITLNADGTYEYYGESSRSVNTTEYYGGTNNQQSDTGTWYVEGNRLYYHSRTLGQGSYLLEKRNHPKNTNDPMIVLDGSAFTTYYNKAPWR